MARSTGPILAIGGITLANQVIINRQEMDWRIPIATGLAAGAFAFMERGPAETFVVGVAWLALVVGLFVRLDPKTPAPMEAITGFLEGRKT